MLTVRLDKKPVPRFVWFDILLTGNRFVTFLRRSILDPVNDGAFLVRSANARPGSFCR
jgi:hypothetical protein